MPSVFLFGSAARARIKEKRTAECPGYERELSDHSASIGMYDYGQTVPIAMCVFLVSSRATVFFWSRTDRGALCGGANGGPGQDVKLPPAHPSTPRLIKEPCCSQRQHEDTRQGCVVNKSAGLSRWLCIRSCGYGVGTPFWAPAHFIMERKMFSE